MSLMTVIKNLKAVPDLPPDIRRPELYMYLESGHYAEHEIICLINEVNRLDLTHAVLEWRMPVTVNEVKSYFTDIFLNTSIRHVTLSIPSNLSKENLQVLRAAIREIREFDKEKQAEVAAYNKNWVYLSFQIHLAKGLDLGVHSATIFAGLLSDLENNTLKTSTITMPTRFYDAGDYGMRELQADLIKLMQSGKFDKFSLVWNGEPQMSGNISNDLFSFFGIFWNDKGSINHYEVDASKVMSSVHVRIVQDHVHTLQQELAKMGDKTRVTIKGSPSAYHTRLFALKPSNGTNIKPKASYRRRKAKIRAKVLSENTEVHRLFNSLHSDELPTLQDVKDTLFTVVNEDQCPDQRSRIRRERATTH